MYTDLEYENIFATGSGKSRQFLSGGFGQGTSLGLRTTTQVKRLGCSLFKNLVETQKLLITDKDIISEISKFTEQKNTFRADEGYHDDLVMSLVIFSWATNEIYFKELTNSNLRLALYEQQTKQIEENLTPFGIVNTGVPDQAKHEVVGDDVWFNLDPEKAMQKIHQKMMENV